MTASSVLPPAPASSGGARPPLLSPELPAVPNAFRRDLPKIYTRELAELIFVNPYCRISDVVDVGIAKRQSASVYLKALVDIGLLEDAKTGRENLYINSALLSLLRDRTPSRFK